MFEGNYHGSDDYFLWSATARRMWQALETLHMTVYFNPEPRDAYKRAGLRGGWMGYFASRSAALAIASAHQNRPLPAGTQALPVCRPICRCTR